MKAVVWQVRSEPICMMANLTPLWPRTERVATSSGGGIPGRKELFCRCMIRGMIGTSRADPCSFTDRPWGGHVKGLRQKGAT